MQSRQRWIPKVSPESSSTLLAQNNLLSALQNSLLFALQMVNQLLPHLEEIIEMRKEGYGYREIGKKFGVQNVTVMRFLQKHGLHHKYGRKRIFMEFDGETKTLAEWSRDPRCKVSDTTLRKRLNKGIPFAEAILNSPLRGKPRKENPTPNNCVVPSDIFYGRLSQGWTEEDAAEVPMGYTRKSWRRHENQVRHPPK